MSFEQLENKIQTARDTAAAASTNFNAAVDRIRSNTTLSVEGKQQAIARLYIDTQQKVGAQAAAEKAAIEAERKAVDRALFGTPANSDPTAMIAFRDAQDRADRIEDPETALSVLTRTDTTGDTELAAAVLNQAVARGWISVVDSYTRLHPTQAALIDELVQLASLTNVSNHLFSAWSYIVPKPIELGNFTDYRIQAIATQAA